VRHDQVGPRCSEEGEIDMGLITLIVAGTYASRLTTRLEYAINPPKSRAVEQVNMQLVYNDLALTKYGEDVVTSVYTAALIVSVLVMLIPLALLGVVTAGLALPLILAGTFVAMLIADSIAMWAVWCVINKESK
jgi:hypothetical protein